MTLQRDAETLAEAWQEFKAAVSEACEPVTGWIRYAVDWLNRKLGG